MPDLPPDPIERKVEEIRRLRERAAELEKELEEARKQLLADAEEAKKLPEEIETKL